MSQLTPNYISYYERAPYYSSMLNAEATAFNPSGDLPSPVPQHSTLRATAPVFVAPGAPSITEPTSETTPECATESSTEQNESPTRIHTARNGWGHLLSPSAVVHTSTFYHTPFESPAMSDAPHLSHPIYDAAAFSLDGVPNFCNGHIEQLTHQDERLNVQHFHNQNTDFSTATSAPADLPSKQQRAPTFEAKKAGDDATEHHYMSHDGILAQDVPFEPNTFTSEQYSVALPAEQDSHRYDAKSGAVLGHHIHFDPISSTFEQSDIASTAEQDPWHHDMKFGAAFSHEYLFPPILSTSEQPGMAYPTEQNTNHGKVAYSNDSYSHTASDKSLYTFPHPAHSATNNLTKYDSNLHDFLDPDAEQSTLRTPLPIMDSPTISLSKMRPTSPPATPPEDPAEAPIAAEPHVSQDIEDASELEAAAPPKRSNSGAARRKGKKAASHSATKDAGVKKSKKKGTATAPSPALNAKAKAVNVKADIDAKVRKAGHVIAAQKKNDTLAKKLGQHIQLVRENGRLKPKGVYWKAPEGDDTIPSEEGKATLVQQLVAAIRNNKDCKEVETSRQFENRWADDALYYSDEEVEIAAWSAVDMMVDVHTNGWTSTIMDTKLRDQLQKTMFCTFGDRFDALVKLLTSSKRTCEDFLKNERFSTIVGNPWELEVRTTCNAASNRAKGELIKDKKGMKRDREEDEDGGRPSKLARSS